MWPIEHHCGTVRPIAIAIRREQCDRQAMSPLPQSLLPARSRVKLSLGALAAATAFALAAHPALAQDDASIAPDAIKPIEEQVTQLDPDALPSVANSRIIGFEADNLEYDNEGDGEVIIASGNVLLSSEDNSVRADQISWDRQSRTIYASGNVRLVDSSGNQLFTDSLELTERFEAGAIDELLVSLRAGGRLAARGGQRGSDGDVILNDAAYTACPVTTLEGCNKTPSWRITASRIIYNPDDSTVSFAGAVARVSSLCPVWPFALMAVRFPASWSLICGSPNQTASKSAEAIIGGSPKTRILLSAPVSSRKRHH